MSDSAATRPSFQITLGKLVTDVVVAAEKIDQKTAYVGQTARLPCRTTVSYYVDWRRLETLQSDHDYIYTNGLIYEQFRPRFSVETTENGNEYTLVIAEVRLNDSAFYLCIEDAGLGNRHFFHLNVTGTQRKLDSLGIVMIIIIFRESARSHLQTSSKPRYGQAGLCTHAPSTVYFEAKASVPGAPNKLGE